MGKRRCYVSIEKQYLRDLTSWTVNPNNPDHRQIEEKISTDPANPANQRAKPAYQKQILFISIKQIKSKFYLFYQANFIHFNQANQKQILFILSSKFYSFQSSKSKANFIHFNQANQKQILFILSSKFYSFPSSKSNENFIHFNQ